MRFDETCNPMSLLVLSVLVTKMSRREELGRWTVEGFSLAPWDRILEGYQRVIRLYFRSEE